MYPILLDLGFFKLYTYGFLLAVAFLLGVLWAINRAKSLHLPGLSSDFMLLLIGIINLSGLIGARLLYAAYFPDIYEIDPLRILTDRGGMVWYGGVFAGTLAGIITLKIYRLPILPIVDLITGPLMLGLAIGRLGCFAAGCCYGKACAVLWAVQFPLGHLTYPQHVHPTQLYESAAVFVLTAILAWVYPHYKEPVGTSLGVCLIGYGFIRFSLEYLRGDVVFWVGQLLTASQVMSLLALFGGIALLVWVWKVKPSRTVQVL